MCAHMFGFKKKTSGKSKLVYIDLLILFTAFVFLFTVFVLNICQFPFVFLSKFVDCCTTTLIEFYHQAAFGYFTFFDVNYSNEAQLSWLTDIYTHIFTEFGI